MVTCVICGKKATGKKRELVILGWSYLGRLDTNAYKREMTVFQFNKGILMEVPNPMYDPTVKKKIIDMWVCPRCKDVYR